MATLGRTYGRPNTPFGSKVYYKPSMGRIIFRIPGVIRKSEKVLAINAKLEALRGSPDHPATKCKGRSWRQFIACLRAEMKKVIGGGV